MRKAYLALLTVITVFCIILGSYRNLVIRHSYHETEPHHEAEEHYEESEEYELEAEHEGEPPEEDVISDYCFSPEDVNEINITLHAGSLEIMSMEGDVTLSDVHSEFIDFTFEDGVLSIHDKNTSDWDLNDPAIFDGVPLLALYVPYDIPVKKLHIGMNAGNITISGPVIDNLDITCDLGDINIDYVRMTGPASIHGKMGNISINSAEFTELVVEEEMGDISIYSEQNLSEFEKHCAISLGTLSVNGTEIGRSFNTDGEEGKLTVTNKMGDINLDWNM